MSDWNCNTGPTCKRLYDARLYVGIKRDLVAKRNFPCLNATSHLEQTYGKNGQCPKRTGPARPHVLQGLPVNGQASILKRVPTIAYASETGLLVESHTEPRQVAKAALGHHTP